MIKVIKEGTLSKMMFEHYRIRCGKCDTIFECDESDTKCKDTTLYIKCPRCGRTISNFMNLDWVVLDD